jgi:hypothetical protein
MAGLRAAGFGGALFVVIIGLAALVPVLVGAGCPSATQAAPTAAAERGIPVRYLTLYRRAAERYRVPWQVLAGIGAIESDHGRSTAPGVRSGVNAHGCCAGPMQFNLRDGPPSTWQRYGVDGDGDGATDVYDPADAIASAANYLRALLRNAGGDVGRAILGYNHSQAYVEDVLARARAYAGAHGAALVEPGTASPVMTACASGGLEGLTGPVDMRAARRLTAPRAYRQLPPWTLAASGSSVTVDSRIYDNVIWILRRYRLHVTAAREAGHRTHGDGTAVDLVPADGAGQAVWDASAGRLARDLGWTPACAHSGNRPACPLVPAIQFVGYDGYPSHGSPRTCSGSCPAHLHISWASPCYGSSELSAPCNVVMAFATSRPV